MLENARQREMLEIIKSRKFVSPKELADELYISISTVRRDLICLEQLGLIQKTHGQVSLFVKNEPAHLLRRNVHRNEKLYIAEIAASYIENGQTVFLDSSTTVNALCPHICNYKNLTVITNSLQSGIDLSSDTDNQIFIIGGELKPNSVSLLGETTVQMLSILRTDLAFISCKSLDRNGVYEEDMHQGYVKEKMVSNAAKTILLCDNSKLGNCHLYRFATLNQIDVIILNTKPEHTFIDACAECNCEVIW